MKPFTFSQFVLIASAAALSCSPLVLNAADPSPITSLDAFPNRPVRLALVNFKTCVEQSKLGKQEQGTFEAMKKQMESVLAEKEKGINELANKLSDTDYLDSLAPEAETEMKRKFRTLSQELSQIQNQYYQVLQQSNVKIIQKIAETIAKAAEKVAKDLKADVVLNEDGAFYYNSDLDISLLVVAEMDKMYDKELKEAKDAPPATAPQPVASPKAK